MTACGDHCINRKQHLRLSTDVCMRARSSLSCCLLCTSSYAQHIHTSTVQVIYTFLQRIQQCCDGLAYLEIGRVRFGFLTKIVLLGSVHFLAQLALAWKCRWSHFPA